MTAQHNEAARVFAKAIQRQWKPLTQDDYVAFGKRKRKHLE